MNKNHIVLQKALNVTKIIILVLLIKIETGQSQTNLSGIYGARNYPLGEYTSLEFNKEGFFKKEVSGEFGTYYYGQGEYRFIDNKLILNYNKTEPIKIGHHVSKIWTNNKDSININFKFFDFDSIPLPAVNVIYKDSLSKYGLRGVAANEKGMAMFNLKRGKTNLQFIITNLGFKQYELFIDNNYNYDISVFLQKGYTGLPILNQIDTLVIDKKRPKYFVVKNKNGSLTTWKKLDE
jgi:hypothetical protein